MAHGAFLRRFSSFFALALKELKVKCKSSPKPKFMLIRFDRSIDFKNKIKRKERGNAFHSFTTSWSLKFLTHIRSIMKYHHVKIYVRFRSPSPFIWPFYVGFTSKIKQKQNNYNYKGPLHISNGQGWCQTSGHKRCRLGIKSSRYAFVTEPNRNDLWERLRQSIINAVFLGKYDKLKIDMFFITENCPCRTRPPHDKWGGTDSLASPCHIKWHKYIFCNTICIIYSPVRCFTVNKQLLKGDLPFTWHYRENNQ